MDIENKELPVLVFSLGEILCIISVRYVRYIEILPEQIDDMPCSPHYLRGMCRFNTDHIALISLNELLFGQQNEIPEQDTDKIVIDNFGFIVSKVFGIESPDMFYHSDDIMSNEKMVRLYTASREIQNKYYGLCKGNVVLEPNIPKIPDLIPIQTTYKEDKNEDNNNLP